MATKKRKLTTKPKQQKKEPVSDDERCLFIFSIHWEGHLILHKNYFKHLVIFLGYQMNWNKYYFNNIFKTFFCREEGQIAGDAKEAKTPKEKPMTSAER